MDLVGLLNSFVDISLANPLVQAFGVSMVRGLVGWAQHALQDDKIVVSEWKELGATFMRILPQALGLSALGVPAVGALFSDVFVTKLAKVADKKK